MGAALSAIGYAVGVALTSLTLLIMATTKCHSGKSSLAFLVINIYLILNILVTTNVWLLYGVLRYGGEQAWFQELVNNREAYEQSLWSTAFRLSSSVIYSFSFWQYSILAFYVFSVKGDLGAMPLQTNWHHTSMLIALGVVGLGFATPVICSNVRIVAMDGETPTYSIRSDSTDLRWFVVLLVCMQIVATILSVTFQIRNYRALEPHQAASSTVRRTKPGRIAVAGLMTLIMTLGILMTAFIRYGTEVAGHESLYRFAHDAMPLTSAVLSNIITGALLTQSQRHRRLIKNWFRRFSCVKRTNSQVHPMVSVQPWNSSMVAVVAQSMRNI